MRRTLALALTFTIASHAISADPPQEFTNSIGMKFKLIPAGEFMMGRSEPLEKTATGVLGPNPSWNEDDLPLHKVRIAGPFYMGVTEVTQEQYEKLVGKNPSYFSKSGQGAEEVKGINTCNFPVENVSWEDAMEFCRRLSAKEGVTYRLPTEAEWEYACRAGSTTRYCFGEDAEQLSEYAWYKKNGDFKTHPVGEKKPNAFGLYDMHGNVWEWCSDPKDEDDYAESTSEYPIGSVRGPLRVGRGGSWYGDAGYCWSSYRFTNHPKYRISNLGFRIARGPISNQQPAEAQSDSR
jgi:formylglycine-generating enzyme required for sulfatase activity